jgi:hypothetical protein
MATKFLQALLVSAALIVPSVAMADSPDKCPTLPTVNTPGDFNKLIKEFNGPPGQNTFPTPATALPANEFAALRNDVRKAACPPPGQLP